MTRLLPNVPRIVWLGPTGPKLWGKSSVRADVLTAVRATELTAVRATAPAAANVKKSRGSENTLEISFGVGTQDHPEHAQEMVRVCESQCGICHTTSMPCCDICHMTNMRRVGLR